MSRTELADKFLLALAQTVDRDRLAIALQASLPSAVGPAQGGPLQGSAATPAQAAAFRDAVLSQLVLADVLDDSILGARPGDGPFPLRAMLGELSAKLATPEGFAFATGLNFYFRAPFDDEETRVVVGYEVSRAYYRFVEKCGLDRKVVAAAAALLAQLLTTELTRVTFENVDHASIFDSTLHERAAGADAQSSRILMPHSFLARVRTTNQVKKRAGVRT